MGTPGVPPHTFPSMNHDKAPSRRRADDLPPPGRRTGEGSASVLPYLAAALAGRLQPGPPGGVERRAPPPRR